MDAMGDTPSVESRSFRDEPGADQVIKVLGRLGRKSDRLSDLAQHAARFGNFGAFVNGPS